MLLADKDRAFSGLITDGGADSNLLWGLNSKT